MKNIKNVFFILLFSSIVMVNASQENNDWSLEERINHMYDNVDNHYHLIIRKEYEKKLEEKYNQDQNAIIDHSLKNIALLKNINGDSLFQEMFENTKKIRNWYRYFFSRSIRSSNIPKNVLKELVIKNNRLIKNNSIIDSKVAEYRQNIKENAQQYQQDPRYLALNQLDLAIQDHKSFYQYNREINDYRLATAAIVATAVAVTSAGVYLYTKNRK